MTEIIPPTGMRSVVLYQDEVDRLPEFNITLPTGTDIGKTWKRRVPTFASGWAKGEYVVDSVPGMTGVRWRRILVIPRLR